MSYVALGAAVQVDVKATASRCSKALPSADYKTAKGRAKAVENASACSADYACATFGVPPGTCGPIAKKIAGAVVDVWNGIFGNSDERARYYRRLAATKRYFAATERVRELWDDMTQAYQEAINRVIALNDRLGKPRVLGKASQIDRATGKLQWGWPHDYYARGALRAAGLPLDARGGMFGHERMWPPNLDQEFDARAHSGGAVTQARIKDAEAYVRARMTQWLDDLRVAEGALSTQLAAEGAVLEAKRRLAQERKATIAQAFADLEAERARRRRLGWIVLGLGAAGLGGTAWWALRKD